MPLHSNPASSILGLTAPDFGLPDTEGELVSLQGFRGSKVVLVFLRHFS